MLYNNPLDMKNCKFFQFKGESLPLSIFSFHVDVTILDTLNQAKEVYVRSIDFCRWKESAFIIIVVIIIFVIIKNNNNKNNNSTKVTMR